MDKGFKLKVVNYSHARNNLKSIIDNVYDNDEEVVITAKNNKSVVVLSLNEYNNSFTKIKKDLQQSLQEHETDKTYTIDEAFDQVRQELLQPK